MTGKIYENTAHALSSMIRRKEISCREAVAAILDRIAAIDKKIGAYITVCAEEAIKAADKVQKQIDEGTVTGSLAGVPIALKDNICTKDIKTTCGSKMLSDFIPPYSATAVQALENAGMIVVGKLNMDEFAMGNSTETSYFKKTRNPWNLSKVPGGSSGGSAAAVASDEIFAALGTDTGGSIRQPAAFCGVVGMKPTYGRVSRHGLVAFASSMDQIGPITKDVEDCALLMNELCGHDPKDSTSANIAVPDFNALRLQAENGLSGIKIGIPISYMGDNLPESIRAAVKRAALYLKEAGAATVDEIELPFTKYAIPAYQIISSSEASANLARYDGIKYGYSVDAYEDISELYSKNRSESFGDEVKRRILLGTYALSSGHYDIYYKKALQVRTLIKNSFEKVFTDYDAILCPVSPGNVYNIGEKANDPMSMYLDDIYTVSVNLAGLPGMSVPCGFDNVGMPTGIQLIGKYFDEGLLLKMGQAIENAQPSIKSKRSASGNAGRAGNGL